MAGNSDWTEEQRRREQRRQILERRRQERIVEQELAAKEGRAAKPDRRADDRRQEQICFVCRTTFQPKANGETICSACRMDSLRGSKSPTWRGPRF